MEAGRTTSGRMSLWAFGANVLMGFGEFAVPFRWLNRVSPYGNYPLPVRLTLTLVGVPVMLLFFAWLLARLVWWAATGMASLRWVLP